MYKNIKGVVFDVGGTLYSSPELDAKVDGMADAMLATKLGISDVKAKEILREEREKNKLRSGDSTKVAALAAFGVARDAFHSSVADIDVAPFVKPDAPLSRCIARLQKTGLVIGVISNFQRRLVLKIFQALGIDPACIADMICEDDNLPLKPNDAPFLEILRRLKLSASETIFVGDSVLKDIVPAKRNGMRTILIRGPKSDGDPSLADSSLNAASEVCGLIAELKG